MLLMLMRLSTVEAVYEISHQRGAKAPASLRICADSPEALPLAYTR